jgi:hypothetical protein
VQAVKTAGMFVELAQGRHPEPVQSIADHVSQQPVEDVENVVAYLNAGHVLVDVMDIENDVLDPTQQIMNGGSVLTDGDWLWRKDYAYYVRRHNILVPDGLLAAIRHRNYIVPSVPEELLVDLAGRAERLAF